MRDDQRKQYPKYKEDRSADENCNKRTQCDKKECGPYKKPDDAHYDIHNKIRKEIFRMSYDIHLLLLKPSPRRKPCHKDIRDREKMIDEPKIVPPDMENIDERIAVMPDQIISGDRKDTHGYSIAERSIKY
jgi:hypothetical protein